MQTKTVLAAMLAVFAASATASVLEIREPAAQCFVNNRKHSDDSCEHKNVGKYACGPGADANKLQCVATSSETARWKIVRNCGGRGCDAYTCECVA